MTRGDRGSALVEFVVVAVCVLVPLSYAALSVGHLQSAAFATSLGAREAARAFSTAPTASAARAGALAAARLAFADHGVAFPEGALRVSCEGGPCLSPGSIVVTELSWQVSLPWLPGASIPVSSRHVEPIDDFRSDAR